MKIYTCTYDLAMPSANKFWVAPNSDFKIGIKVELRGQAYAGDFTLKQNGQTVTADEDKTAGFTTYTIKSGGPGSVIYTVDVSDAQQKFTLVQVVTDSTVFDVGGSGGGDVPADVATQSWVNAQISDFVDEDELTAYATKDELTGYVENGDLTAYYTKSETSSAAEIGTALEGKQPAGNYLTAETEPAFAAMSADIVVDDDLTAYYTKSETSSAAELADAFAGSSGGGSVYVVSSDTLLCTELSVIKMNEAEYTNLLLSGDERDNALYVVDSTYANAFGSSIKNVGEPALSSDAATKNYVDAATAGLVTNLSGVAGIMKISQADYDVISAGGTLDADTLYVII